MQKVADLIEKLEKYRNHDLRLSVNVISLGDVESKDTYEAELDLDDISCSDNQLLLNINLCIDIIDEIIKDRKKSKSERYREITDLEIGDTCYVIEKCVCNITRRSRPCEPKTAINKIYVRDVKQRFGTLRRCQKIFKRTFRPYHINMVGTSVFKTEEDAIARINEIKLAFDALDSVKVVPYGKQE